MKTGYEAFVLKASWVDAVTRRGPNGVGRLFAALVAALSVSTTLAQDYPHPSDVASIDAIIDAYYEVISGPVGYAYDAARDSSLHAPIAIITRLSEAGLDKRHDLAIEQSSVPAVYEEAFFEVEVNRIVEHYGNMAHVWSTYEVRSSPHGDASAVGINSISLYWDAERWWIASWSTQLVEDGGLPDRYRAE